MFSFFRRQKTTDSDKTGKGDKNEGRIKEKQPAAEPAGRGEAVVMATPAAGESPTISSALFKAAMAAKLHPGTEAAGPGPGCAGRTPGPPAAAAALFTSVTARMEEKPAGFIGREVAVGLQPSLAPAPGGGVSLRAPAPAPAPAPKPSPGDREEAATSCCAPQDTAKTSTTPTRTIFTTTTSAPAPLGPNKEPTQSKPNEHKPILETNPEPADTKRSEHSEEERDKRNLVNQEAKFQEQLATLTAQLSERDTETNKLTYKMEELQRDVQVKSWGMDRLQAELSAAHKESECVRQKLRKMEEDVTLYRQKNQELAEELLKKADELTAADNRHQEKISQLEENIKELETTIKKLETDLEEVRKVRDTLEEEKAEMEAEREEEMKIVQEALEETQEEKDRIQARFEKDFERLRTVNTDREQQLLNDFEWKLREVEQACKRRLEDKDKKADEKIAKYQKDMANKIKEAEEQLNEAQKLKSCEAEATQLRGVMHEQQRIIRNAQRQTEQLQVNEKMLKEEVSRLRTAIDTEKNMSQNLQSINDKKVSDLEKKHHTRMEEQKGELDQQWEQRMRRECFRLKTELNQLHTEEKQIALNSLRSEKDKEINSTRQKLEQNLEEALQKVLHLTENLNDKEAFYQKEIERIQTNSDRDILDLRRKLDKMDMSYQDQIEKLNERHEQEIEQLNWESSRKIQQLEQNWQHQTSSTRTTLELVKEQMERDTQAKLEALESKHREKIELQWEQLTEEKETQIEQIQENYHKELQRIMEEFQQKQKHSSSRETELQEKIFSLESKLQGKCSIIGDLQGNADLLHGSVQVLNEQILSQTKEIQQSQIQSAQKLRERELELRSEWEVKLAAVHQDHSTQLKQSQQQHEAVQQELLLKIDSLSKLLEESHTENRISHSLPEDIQRINDLTQALEERDHALESLAEEKRFYQLELVNRETTCNQVVESQPTAGLMETLQYANGPKKKGGGKGKGIPPPQHEPTPPRLGPKPSRKHKKGGGNSSPQVTRSKSLDFKNPPKSHTKIKNTHTAPVPESPDENYSTSTL